RPLSVGYKSSRSTAPCGLRPLSVFPGENHYQEERSNWSGSARRFCAYIFISQSMKEFNTIEIAAIFCHKPCRTGVTSLLKTAFCSRLG
ncbi:MAG: hypothetical protein ACLPJW_02230, partial [Rhodomicrobium sp.]